MYKLYLNVMEYIRQRQRNVWICTEMCENVEEIYENVQKYIEMYK